MMRQTVSEKRFGNEAGRQGRLFLVKLAYSFLSAVLAALFLAVGYFVHPALAHLFVGDEGALFDAHIHIFDADVWFKMTLFLSIYFFLVHLIVNIFTSGGTSIKRSLAVAGAYALILIFVLVETSSFDQLFYFFPLTACVFLFWPVERLGKDSLRGTSCKLTFS
jgi:hypothetical protein